MKPTAAGQPTRRQHSLAPLGDGISTGIGTGTGTGTWPGPPRARWFGTLKARLMVASTLVIAASVAVTTSVVLQRVQERSEGALMDLERDSAERMAALLGQRVLALQRMLRSTAGAMPAAAQGDAGAAIAYLSSQPALMASFAGVSIIDTSGQLLALNDGQKVAQPPLQVADRAHFQQAMKGMEVVSAPLQGRLHKEPLITLAVPVFDAEFRVMAVLCGWIRLAGENLFDGLHHSSHGGANSVLTMVADSSGAIVAHPRRERLMQPVAGEPGMADIAARWAAQGRAARPGALAVHAQGRFISMVAVPGAGWMLIRQTPDTDLLGGLAQAASRPCGGPAAWH